MASSKQEDKAVKDLWDIQEGEPVLIFHGSRMRKAQCVQVEVEDNKQVKYLVRYQSGSGVSSFSRGVFAYPYAPPRLSPPLPRPEPLPRGWMVKPSSSSTSRSPCSSGGGSSSSADRGASSSDGSSSNGGPRTNQGPTSSGSPRSSTVGPFHSHNSGFGFSGTSSGFSFSIPSSGFSFSGPSSGFSFSGPSSGFSFSGPSSGFSFSGTSSGFSFSGTSSGFSFSGTSSDFRFSGTRTGFSSISFPILSDDEDDDDDDDDEEDDDDYSSSLQGSARTRCGPIPSRLNSSSFPSTRDNSHTPRRGFFSTSLFPIMGLSSPGDGQGTRGPNFGGAFQSISSSFPSTSGSSFQSSTLPSGVSSIRGLSGSFQSLGSGFPGTTRFPGTSVFPRTSGCGSFQSTSRGVPSSSGLPSTISSFQGLRGSAFTTSSFPNTGGAFPSTIFMSASGSFQSTSGGFQSFRGSELTSGEGPGTSGGFQSFRGSELTSDDGTRRGFPYTSGNGPSTSTSGSFPGTSGSFPGTSGGFPDTSSDDPNTSTSSDGPGTSSSFQRRSGDGPSTCEDGTSTSSGFHSPSIDKPSTSYSFLSTRAPSTLISPSSFPNNSQVSTTPLGASRSRSSAPIFQGGEGASTSGLGSQAPVFKLPSGELFCPIVNGWDYEWIPENRVLRYSAGHLKQKIDVSFPMAVKREQKDDRHVTSSWGSNHSESSSSGGRIMQPPSKRSRLSVVRGKGYLPCGSSGIAVGLQKESLGKKEVHIHLPKALSPLLMRDWELVTLGKKLFTLPAKKTISVILAEYVSFQENCQTREKKYAVSGLVAMIKEYFDVMISSQLLYKFEKQQHADVLAQYPTFQMSQLYGGAHLLRLFQQLGPMLACSPLDDSSLNVLLSHLQDFLEYLAHDPSRLFTPATDYKAPPAEYQQKAE